MKHETDPAKTPPRVAKGSHVPVGKAASLWLYEATKMVFGRGFDFPQVHQKAVCCLTVPIGFGVHGLHAHARHGSTTRPLSNGPDRFRRAQESKWTAGKATRRRVSDLQRIAGARQERNQKQSPTTKASLRPSRRPEPGIEPPGHQTAPRAYRRYGRNLPPVACARKGWPEGAHPGEAAYSVRRLQVKGWFNSNSMAEGGATGVRFDSA